jgi:F-type H+-transporting ATPase subunit a
MSDISIESAHGYDIGWIFGYSNYPFFLINLETVIQTWIIMGFMIAIVLLLKYLSKHYAIVNYAVTIIIKLLYDMIFQSIGFFSFEHFSFISSLFIFIAACNISPIIPWLEEPTQDINTTFALGITSFLYIQASAIYIMGFWQYLYMEYLSPIWLLPLHLVGKMASILSISLRLFGNIFGGAIITKIYTSTALQYLSILPITKFIILNVIFTLILGYTAVLFNTVITIFFTIFEGFLQAFVFTILSLTYLSIAVKNEHDH